MSKLEEQEVGAEVALHWVGEPGSLHLLVTSKSRLILILILSATNQAFPGQSKSAHLECWAVGYVAGGDAIGGKTKGLKSS